MESRSLTSAEPTLDSSASTQWYAVWTRSRHEQVVREQLQRKRFEGFCPRSAAGAAEDRKKKIDWPLFPGYCFVRFDAADTLPSPQVHGCRQYRVVRGKPAPIPDYG